MAILGSVEKAEESIKSDQSPVSSKSSPTIPIPDTLVTTYLQMINWTEFRPAYLNYPDGIKIMCMDAPDVAFYRFLYASLGKQWRWGDGLFTLGGEIRELLG